MITGATRAKVDAVWQKMWEGGITNPIEVISQLTYLMFIRSLDEKELEAERMEQLLGTPQQHKEGQPPHRVPSARAALSVCYTSVEIARIIMSTSLFSSSRITCR